MLVLLYLLFFFKQKTAYEMRISDWSSDVCSSDLAEHPERRGDAKPVADEPESADRTEDEDRTKQRQRPLCAPPQRHRRHQREPFDEQQRAADEQRSEEHTSELQSLMRISYAAFCLKKKNTQKHVRYKHTKN